MTTAKPKRKRASRSVFAETEDGIYPMIERVSSTRCKLKPGPARGLYVLCRAIADEHDHTRAAALASMAKGSEVGMERVEFYRHASAALRMVAERCLKSWDTFRLLGVEKAVAADFRAATIRLSKEHRKKSPTERLEIDGGPY